METSMCTTRSSRPSAWPRKFRASRSLSIAALVLVAAATTVGLHAQSNTPAASKPTLDLRAYLSAPINLPSANSATDASSSSSLTPDATTDERLNLSSTDSTQPPPRRSYGRPRYNDKSHNPDGSNRYTFEVGAGFTMPTGGTHDYLKPSYKFQVGAGRNFNKSAAVLAQFDWDNFGIQTSTLNTLLPIYQSLCGSGCTGASISQIGGTNHAWSFSINPMYTFTQSEKTGAYVVAGVGFYHKVTNITTPVTGTYCDYYYGCYSYPANSTIDKYTSNAPGFNGGLGFTYRPSRFAGEKFFVEARYVYIDNKSRPYYDGTKGTSLSATYFNLFPQNSNTTSYVPVTVGLRF